MDSSVGLMSATRPNAVWLVVRDASILIGSGSVVGLFFAWALGRLVYSELFGVRTFDALTVAPASCLLALVALSAAMIPAWRAVSVSPTKAMRFD